MKFSEILKNNPEDPPRPPGGKRPPPIPGPGSAAPAGEPPVSGFRMSSSQQGPAPARAAPPSRFFDEAPEGEAEAEPPLPPQAARPSDAEIEGLYRELAAFFERAAAGEAAPDTEAAESLLKVRALAAAPDHRLLALAMQDPACSTPGAAGLHHFLFASFLSRGLALDEAESLTLLVAALAGAPPPPLEGRDGGREREKGEAFKLASVFHGLLHPGGGSPPLRPEQAAAALVEQKPSVFSPAGIRRFINEFSLYPPGSIIRLSSGRLAVVREPHTGYPTRPTVRLLDVSDSPDKKNEGLMDLREHPLIRISHLKDPTKELEPLKRRKRRSHMGWNILGF